MVLDGAEHWYGADNDGRPGRAVVPQELRKLKRHGWRVVNHFLLKKGDIDHVLIGPGGVYALETKWSADRGDDFALARERDAVAQAASNARSMTLWSELRKSGVQVRPVVLLWGGDIRRWDERQRTRMLNDVPVLTGPSIRDWVRSLPTDVLDPSEVEGVWTTIEAHAKRVDRDREQLAVPPPSVTTSPDSGRRWPAPSWASRYS